MGKGGGCRGAGGRNAWLRRAVRTALGVATAAALELGAVRAEAQTAPAVGAASQGSGAAPGTSEPEPGHVALRYQLGKGSFGCESEATFRLWVAGKLRDDPFTVVGPVTHTLTLQIAREAPGFRGVAELRDGQGRVVMLRDVLERTCVDVVDRMVVVVLLSVFPPRLPAAPPVPVPAPPAPPAACGPCDEASRKERDARAAKDEEVATALRELRNELQALKRKGYGRGMDLTFALSAGALLTANLTSNVGPGVWLHGEARSGPLMLGLELRSVLPSRLVAGPYDSDLSQFVALLTPCGRYSYFFGCAVAGVGFQVDTDSDYPSPSPATYIDPLLQLGGRVGVEVPLGETRFAVRGWGEVLYSTPSTSYTYTGTGYSVDRPDVSAFFGVGFVVKFGDEGAR